MPGNTVTLTGENWQGDTTVHIQVDDSQGATWQYVKDVSVAADGSITTSFQLPPNVIALYGVLATGLETTRQATTTFTDSSYNLDQWANKP